MNPDHRPISPPAERGVRGDELPAYVSNGLIGLRVRENPLQPGMCMISGFVGEHLRHGVEAAAAAPYPLSGDVALDGQRARDRTDAYKAVDQTYDFMTAELTSRLVVVIGDVSADIRIVTFASRTNPTIVCQEVQIAASKACTLELRLELGVDGVRGRTLERRLDTPGEDAAVCDGSLLRESEGARGRCGLALKTAAPPRADASQTPSDRGGTVSTTYRLKVRKARPAVSPSWPAWFPTPCINSPIDRLYVCLPPPTKWVLTNCAVVTGMFGVTCGEGASGLSGRSEMAGDG